MAVVKNYDSNIQAMGATLTKKKVGSELTDLVVGSLTQIGEIKQTVEEIDITTLDSPGGADEKAAGKITVSDMPFAGKFKKFDDEEQYVKLLAILDSKERQDWIITFPSGAKLEFNGFIKELGTGEFAVGAQVTFSASVSISGKPVFTKASTT